MTRRDPDTLTIAIRVAEPAMAERIAALLDGLPGIEVVSADARADLVLGIPEPNSREPVQPLTPRERDVIALLAEGLSNKGIALRLGISPDTVKFHVGRLIDKLDAAGRTDAVTQAARRGIIHL